jgi:hypothetical protein
MVAIRQLSYGRTMRDLDTVSIAGVAILVTKSHRNQLNLLPESLGFLPMVQLMYIIHMLVAIEKHFI